MGKRGRCVTSDRLDIVCDILTRDLIHIETELKKTADFKRQDLRTHHDRVANKTLGMLSKQLTDQEISSIAANIADEILSYTTRCIIKHDHSLPITEAYRFIIEKKIMKYFELNDIAIVYIAKTDDH